MLPQHLLSYLDHPVHATGGLQGAGAGYGCNYYIDYVCRRRARFQTEAENKDRKTYSGDCSQGETAVAGAYIKSCQNDQQLDDHGECHSSLMLLKMCSILFVRSKYRNFKVYLYLGKKNCRYGI